MTNAGDSSFRRDVIAGVTATITHRHLSGVFSDDEHRLLSSERLSKHLAGGVSGTKTASHKDAFPKLRRQLGRAGTMPAPSAAEGPSAAAALPGDRPRQRAPRPPHPALPASLLINDNKSEAR